jgi:hypothetical protein
MKCPKCGQTEYFKTDLWEVYVMTGYLDGQDVQDTKHAECVHLAINPTGASCCEAENCYHLTDTQGFLDGKEPFQVQELPDFDLPPVRDLLKSALSLLACPELTSDEFESFTREVIKKAHSDGNVFHPTAGIRSCQEGVAS